VDRQRLVELAITEGQGCGIAGEQLDATIGHGGAVAAAGDPRHGRGDVDAGHAAVRHRGRQEFHGPAVAEADLEDPIRWPEIEKLHGLLVEPSGLARHDPGDQPAEHSGRPSRLPRDEGRPPHGCSCTEDLGAGIPQVRGRAARRPST
jgi:hypothetical protein